MVINFIDAVYGDKCIYILNLDVLIHYLTLDDWRVAIRSVMWRKLLITILTLSVVFEILFAAAGFVVPELLLEHMALAVTPDTLFLAFGLAWCLVIIAATCFLALKWIVAKNLHGNTLTYFLGFWWIAVGLAIYFKSGRIDNLFGDTLKGLLIVIFNFKSIRT